MVPKGTIIGAGQAAALTKNKMNMVDILGALWPHPWVLYAAHVKRTVGHCMVTASGTPEFDALLKLVNIIYPAVSSQVNAALKASAAHDGPHAFEPLSMARLAHYALSDKGHL